MIRFKNFVVFSRLMNHAVTLLSKLCAKTNQNRDKRLQNILCLLYSATSLSMWIAIKKIYRKINAYFPVKNPSSSFVLGGKIGLRFLDARLDGRLAGTPACWAHWNVGNLMISAKQVNFLPSSDFINEYFSLPIRKTNNKTKLLLELKFNFDNIFIWKNLSVNNKQQFTTRNLIENIVFICELIS